MRYALYCLMIPNLLPHLILSWKDYSLVVVVVVESVKQKTMPCWYEGMLIWCVAFYGQEKNNSFCFGESRDVWSKWSNIIYI